MIWASAWVLVAEAGFWSFLGLLAYATRNGVMPPLADRGISVATTWRVAFLGILGLAHLIALGSMVTHKDTWFKVVIGVQLVDLAILLLQIATFPLTLVIAIAATPAALVAALVGVALATERDVPDAPF